MKIPVASLDDAHRRLAELGAQCVEAEIMEDNWVLDNERDELLGAGLLLRIRRRGDRGWLTYKGTASYSGGVKSREEIESMVSEPGVLLDILARIGMRVVRRYQKRRETWRLGTVEVALDTTPMGCFVEIEGPAGDLPALARALALDPTRAVHGSYLDMWREYRRSHPGAPEDMLFP